MITILFILLDLLILSFLAYIVYWFVKRYRKRKREEEDIKNTYIEHDKTVFIDYDFRDSQEYKNCEIDGGLDTYPQGSLNRDNDEVVSDEPEFGDGKVFSYVSYLSFLRGLSSEVRTKYSEVKDKFLTALEKASPEERINVLKTFPELVANTIRPDDDLGYTKLLEKAEALGIENYSNIAQGNLYDLVDKICKDKWKNENPIPNILPSKCDECKAWHTSDKRCDCGKRRQVAYIDGNWEIGYHWSVESY